MRTILAGSGFRDYQALVYEAPLHQVLIYQNARGLGAIIQKIRSDAAKAVHGAKR